MNSLVPIIVSASRSTDIPYFYAKWFINRLRLGYCVGYNPFNRKPYKVSFEKTKVVVFWSKNPKPIIPYLKELDDIGIHYYFQFTLNDYEQENLEPNVARLSDRIDTFKSLSELIGKQKVIWRFDPLILTDKININKLLDKIQFVGDKIHNYTDKLVFSFADIDNYKKVKNNLRRDNINYKNWSNEDMENIAKSIMQINKQWNLKVATCAENIDLDSFSIEHNRCIDGELMKNIFCEDKALIYYLNYGKLPEKNVLFIDSVLQSININRFKDNGQRKACGCMISKDIGMYNTCMHFCEYCYANTSKAAVMKNMSLFKDINESIIKF